MYFDLGNTHYAIHQKKKEIPKALASRLLNNVKNVKRYSYTFHQLWPRF